MPGPKYVTLPGYVKKGRRLPVHDYTRARPRASVRPCVCSVHAPLEHGNGAPDRVHVSLGALALVGKLDAGFASAPPLE